MTESENFSIQKVSYEELSTSSEVYLILRHKIFEQAIPPSTRINIEKIAKELGVSATPVREALGRLQGDNLVIASSNKGYSTTPVLNSKGVKDLFEFRLLIEPWAARIAASNSLANPGYQLEAELKGFNPGQTNPKYEMTLHDIKFHKLIISATQNENVVQSFSQSHCHLHLFRMYRKNWDWKTSIEQHREISRAILNANPDAAEQAMRNHLHSAYTGFIESLEYKTELEIRDSISENHLINKLNL